MKQIIKKYLGWLKDSNRPKHMKAGILVLIVMLELFNWYIDNPEDCEAVSYAPNL